VARLLLFTAVTTTVEIALALTVAVYLDQVCELPRPLETALLLPMFVIPVVAGLLFRYLLDPGEGLIGAVFGWFGAAAPGLLGDPDRALAAVMLMDVWRMWPFVFVILYAGIKSLPREPIEAVRLDGATTWQAVRFVILPMLRSTLVVAVVLKVIESLKAFTEIYVMTGGGPGDATSLLPLFVVKQAFEFFRLGYGAAASTVIFLLGVGAATLLLWLQNRRKKQVPA
jgi:multiple sugar transport system permease protein